MILLFALLIFIALILIYIGILIIKLYVQIGQLIYFPIKIKTIKKNATKRIRKSPKKI